MSEILEILKLVNEIDFVDLRFTDSLSCWHHVTLKASLVDEEFFKKGIAFDGSSIAGWAEIHQSDMIMLPDPKTWYMDPFTADKTLCLICDIIELKDGKNYSRDPRSLARRAEQYLIKTGLGDNAYFGPELEFFLFDNVQFGNKGNRSFYIVDDLDGEWNSATEYDGGNKGHRPRNKGGYFPVSPVDSAQDIRSEMAKILTGMGVAVEKHHHEVASLQHEIGTKFDTLVKSADTIQMCKHVIKNVAASYNKTATFMPKPIYGDNGSGMHVHQSFWKNNLPVFAGSDYAGLSDTALFYIGGIIKHAKALNAFTNPTTNSYKRLVPGYEAPVLLAYSAHNRSASCRIPYSSSPAGKRIEVRFPDPAANPYLAFSAMLMAGLDGVKNKIHPGSAAEKDLYHLPAEELAVIPTVCGSLNDALKALSADREFLKKGDVFSDDLIDAYIDLKMKECDILRTSPHPVEFEMYYSC